VQCSVDFYEAFCILFLIGYIVLGHTMHTHTVAVSGHHVHNAQYFGQQYEHCIRPGPPLCRVALCTQITNLEGARLLDNSRHCAAQGSALIHASSTVAPFDLRSAQRPWAKGSRGGTKNHTVGTGVGTQGLSVTLRARVPSRRNTCTLGPFLRGAEAIRACPSPGPASTVQHLDSGEADRGRPSSRADSQTMAGAPVFEISMAPMHRERRPITSTPPQGRGKHLYLSLGAVLQTSIALARAVEQSVPGNPYKLQRSALRIVYEPPAVSSDHQTSALSAGICDYCSWVTWVTEVLPNHSHPPVNKYRVCSRFPVQKASAPMMHMCNPPL
jgi:hypothetical protein